MAFRPSPFLVAALLAVGLVAAMTSTFVAHSNIGPAFAAMSTLEQTAQTASVR